MYGTCRAQRRTWHFTASGRAAVRERVHGGGEKVGLRDRVFEGSQRIAVKWHTFHHGAGCDGKRRLAVFRRTHISDTSQSLTGFPFGHKVIKGPATTFILKECNPAQRPLPERAGAIQAPTSHKNELDGERAEESS